MIKTVNPGSRLELSGSFELGASLVDCEAVPQAAELATLVMDRESNAVVSLADLLRSFMYDPTERVTGPIRITIEPA